ncbi:MAG TPA: RimK family protein [Kiritimatiellia bacterium]|nr:RimK family protein [Kiritimatiellia bacterium]HMO98419.1 RimK family protein [Kiritimatiellia bacterium]HMP95837.1 RimK family protein [Kiritimatiellia bacterium]
MYILVVVDNPKYWPLNIQNVEVVQARKYITEPAFTRIGDARVFNLCRSYRYQSTGYYVSLLAAARGHKPIPDVSTIRDLQFPTIVRLASETLEEEMDRALADHKGNRFTLSIYFGRNLAKRYDRLSMELFNLFRAPLLRAEFVKEEGKWQLQGIGPIAVSEVPESHHAFIVIVASDFFRGRHRRLRPRAQAAYSMAILTNPKDEGAPSNPRALEKFIEAAEKIGIDAELIDRDAYSRLPEYDALFIRETTSVTNHTFRFARRAEAEGLVVIDDPQSILKCTNKVYLEELLTRHRIPTPKSIIVHRDNLDLLPYEIGFPLILKQPDSSYSVGVIKIDNKEQLEREAPPMLEDSELLIAQEFLPTEFDWRIGVIDGKPFYACKYYMARKHWQIVRREKQTVMEGRVQAIALRNVPDKVIDVAVKASRLIGDGLYGIDLKQIGNKLYVIEINDNPNLDAGFEDAVVKNRLYETVMKSFLRRIKAAKQLRKSR